MTAHREALKAELANIDLENVSVIDLGAGAKPAQRYIGHVGCTFFTVDKSDYNQPNLVWDITKPLPLEYKFDVAFCLEVIEHVEFVQGLINNLEDCLKPGGILYMSVPFQFQIHSDEDYWRFTDNGIRLLLKDFKDIEIKSIDGDSGYFVKAIR